VYCTSSESAGIKNRPYGSGTQDAAKRQRGGQSPSCFLMAGAIRKQDGDWPPRCRVAALPRPVCQSHNFELD